MAYRVKAYTLREESTESGTRYFISFKDGQGKSHELEVSEQFFMEFRQMERRNRSLLQWDERHREFNEVWDETLYRRALRVPKSLDERMVDLEQRAGRTVRQGNKNPKVDVVRYVTEGTFDAYLYQIIENKQKFISQIMTSKSPARSVEDIDEAALSYAEIKALAVGNPYIKEKMDLDIQVSKLQLLKQSFLSQKYEMEDKAVRYFPNEIRQCEQRIADYESDIALAKENTPPDRETFPEMQIHDVVYTEKKEAGQAIIEACKAMKSADAVLIGRYRGFPMKLSYDSFQKVFVISMYGKQVYHVPLGTDIHGNITRLDNKIQEIPDKMLRCQDKLENLKVQLENAKEEAQKEFPQEAELAEKVARLGELNVLLDMDKKDQVLLDDGEGVEIEPEQKKKERER